MFWFHTGRCTKANGKKGKSMEKGLITTLIQRSMKENGRTMKRMDTASMNRQKESIRVTGKMIKNMVTAI